MTTQQSHTPHLAARTPEERRRALVLSGGGMRVCYQVGALCALQEADYGFGFFDATSGGGLNLAMLLSGLSPLEMQARWRDIRLHRSLSLMPLSSYLRKGNCVAMGSADGFRHYVLPHLGIDLALVSSASGVTGNFNVLDYKRKLVTEFPHTGMDEDLLIAGLSLPGVMPPVTRGDDLYLDAAFVQDANLMAAVRAGADELWVLWCLGNTGEYEGGPLNAYVQMLEMAAHGALHRELREIAELNERIAAGDSPHGQHQPIRVHLIRPPCPLPRDPEIYLGRVSTADLMAQGYRDTRSHLQNLEPAGTPLEASSTRMQSARPGIRFRETMKGFFSLDHNEPGAGVAAGREARTELSMHASVHIDDIDRFTRDPDHCGLIHGEIDFAPLGTGIPCLGGTFNLFSPGGQPGMKHMVYELGFQHDGREYYLAGHKEVRNQPGLDLWRDTTTLYVRLHQGRDDTGPVVGAGTLRLGVGELLKLLSTLRATDAGGIRGKLRAVGHFGRFFLKELQDSYGTD
jgi:predicted acylesterase/phospholipase RssA